MSIIVIDCRLLVGQGDSVALGLLLPACCLHHWTLLSLSSLCTFLIYLIIIIFINSWDNGVQCFALSADGFECPRCPLLLWMECLYTTGPGLLYSLVGDCLTILASQAPLPVISTAFLSCHASMLLSFSILFWSFLVRIKHFAKLTCFIASHSVANCIFNFLLCLTTGSE